MGKDTLYPSSLSMPTWETLEGWIRDEIEVRIQSIAEEEVTCVTRSLECLTCFIQDRIKIFSLVVGRLYSSCSARLIGPQAVLTSLLYTV